MGRLGTRGLLFILGCCIGWHLCVFCGQLVVFSLCFSLLCLLFHTRQSFDDGKAQQACARSSTNLTKLHLTAGDSPETICAPRSTRSSIQSSPKSVEMLCRGDEEAGRSKITSGHRSDMFTFKVPLHHFCFDRSSSFHSHVMSLAERDVVLAWLRGVGKADAGMSKTCSPSSVGPALPLTAKRLAGHLATSQEEFQTSQIRIDTSDCCSSSVPIAGSQSDTGQRSFIPIRRTFGSHGYDAEGPSSRKVPKNEPNLNVPLFVGSSPSPTPSGRKSSDDADTSSITTINVSIPSRNAFALTRLAGEKEALLRWFQTLEQYGPVHAQVHQSSQCAARASTTPAPAVESINQEQGRRAILTQPQHQAKIAIPSRFRSRLLLSDTSPCSRDHVDRPTSRLGR